MSEQSSLRFEIGHVLFIDIVGYSKLLINEQSDQIEQLRQIVRGTEQFRAAEAEGRLQRLPTGDGGALVFRTNPEAPLLCAMEISRALKDQPDLHVRMGVHSGPVNEVADLNDQTNIAGAGVNIAQRVMDCGDAGHILLSKRVADDLAPYPKWNRYLHPLGECEVKHGERLALVNFFDDDVGNPEAPRRCQTGKAPPVSPVTDKAARRRFSWVVVGVAALLLAGAAIGALLLRWQTPRSASQSESATAISANSKSIAVLPFDNLSGDPDNAYFADGIQEEILTRLSRIADLKVISRTSTQKYKSAPANLREIAQQLGVAHILEGSVQKAGEQVRVSVQLIKAENDSHVWADRFDRQLTDIFAVESEIAANIANHLQAKLSGAEQQAIATRPTENREAYELYLKGRYFAGKRFEENLKKSIDYFTQAIEKDPNYALAYAGLADSFTLLPQYSPSAKPTDCYQKARVAVDKALALQPNLSEAHVSLGLLLMDGDNNYKEGRRELEKAIQLDPNSSTAHYFLGNGVFKRFGQFGPAIAEFKRALELDPLSPVVNANLALCYIDARRFPEALGPARKAIELDPSYPYAHGMLAQALILNGDISAGIEEWEKLVPVRAELPPLIFLVWANSLKGDRERMDYYIDRATKLEAKERPFYYGRAVIALARGDKNAAIANLEKSHETKEAGSISRIKVDPILDPLRGDPRFEQLVNKVIPPDQF